MKNRILGLFLLIFIVGGELMAEQTKTGNDGVRIRDAGTGIEIDFPREPLEMSFDIPFQNTPPGGTVRLYSVPGSAGLFVLGIFQSGELSRDWLTKESLSDFLNRVLAPHFFYDPAIFRNEQIFGYAPEQIAGFPGAKFQMFYLDHETEKQVEGYATIRDEALYVYFYLSSVHDFDREAFKHFVDSVRFPVTGSSKKEIPFEAPERIE